MLVLSRKQSERIRLGKDIIVTVVRVAGDKVRLGIDAPADMVVLRDELDTRAVPSRPTESSGSNVALT
ncbi:MAG TPA: carbon storage regulator [Pirellulales bacterium]|jgi:carbon storage regulator|nr:carbon storage regulator [Pirellulales bacterium]